MPLSLFQNKNGEIKDTEYSKLPIIPHFQSKKLLEVSFRFLYRLLCGVITNN